MLILAASAADVHNLELLIRYGAIVSVEDHTGCTTLHAVTEGTFLAGARILLHHGVDLNSRNHDHDKAPFAASLAERKHLFTLLYLESAVHISNYLCNGNML